MNQQVDNRQIVYLSSPPGMGWGGDAQDDEIDLLALWSVVWRRKFFVIGVTLLATLAAVYVTLYVLPETYQSQVVILSTGNDNSKIGGLASFASSLPIPISLPGGGGSDQLIMAFLESQNFKVKLIETYGLLPRLCKKKWDPVKQAWMGDVGKDTPTPIKAVQMKALDSIYDVTQDKKTALITISWIDEDPAFAAEMLQRVIAELNYYLANDYESDAKRERKFVDKQLATATAELKSWEQQVPTSDLSLATIKREVLAATTVYTELRKQLEMAKLTEEKEVVNFKIIDPPFVPEVRFKPKRTLICALTMVSAAFISLLVVFVQEGITTRRKKEEGIVEEV